MTEVYVLSVVAVLVLVFYLAGKKKRERRAAKNQQDVRLQQALQDLTDRMKTICERSDTNFDLWAGLNDDILECAINYYNDLQNDQQEKYDIAMDFVSKSASKVNEIAESSNQEPLLAAFSEEIKTNKLNQSGTPQSGAPV